jgi:hypothetical protein
MLAVTGQQERQFCGSEEGNGYPKKQSVLLISCKTKKKNGMSLNKMEIK